MSYADDNTSVIRMKRDFDQFLSNQDDSRVPLFSMDQQDSFHNVSRSPDSGSFSVRELFEKEKKLKLKEAEYLATKGQLVHMQTKLSSLETSNKRAKLDYDQEMDKLRNELAQEKMKVSDVWAKVKFMTEKETQARENLTQCQKEAEQRRRKFEEEILTLQKDKLQLSDDLQQEKESSWEKITELRAEQMRKDTELKICQCDLEEAKSQLKLQRQRSSDITNQMKDCEELKLKSAQAEQKIKELELTISRMEEDHVIAKGMKTQLTTFQEMEKENRKLVDENQYLRDIQENNLLLKEQHESMKKKLGRMEEKMTEYSRLLMENEELKSRLDSWENADRAGGKIRSPSDLSKRVGELQTSEVLMLSKQGELQTSLHLKENTVKTLNDDVHSLQQQLKFERTKYQQQCDLLKRLQRKLLLVTKERDGYKHTIDMYESEVTMSLPTGPGSGGSGGGVSHERFHQLEETANGYKSQTEFLEGELNRVNKDLLNAKQMIKKLEQKVAENEHRVQNGQSLPSDQQTILQLRERIADLEKRLEKCEEEKFTLEARIEQRHLQGDYDPTKLKVLHFKMNPHDKAKASQQVEMEKLKEENEKLKQRLKVLEESGGRIDDLTVVVEKRLQEPGSSKDIEEMRAQLCSAELKNKRLMEAFKITSQEMREVCYQLLGYRIDLHVPMKNQHKLTSMFAESPNDYFLFQQSDEGEIQMLGTDFSSSLHDLVETYLTRSDSIPAFLSGVSLELFSRQTMSFR